MIGDKNLILELKIQGKINEIPCSMIVDTAADITIVNPDLFQNNLLHLEDVDRHILIKTVSGEIFRYIATKNVVITVGNISMKLDVALAKISDQCILGLDFLYTTGLLNDFQSIINRNFNINQKNKVVSMKQITLSDPTLETPVIPGGSR